MINAKRVLDSLLIIGALGIILFLPTPVFASDYDVTIETSVQNTTLPSPEETITGTITFINDNPHLVRVTGTTTMRFSAVGGNLSGADSTYFLQPGNQNVDEILDADGGTYIITFTATVQSGSTCLTGDVQVRGDPIPVTSFTNVNWPAVGLNPAQTNGGIGATLIVDVVDDETGQVVDGARVTVSSTQYTKNGTTNPSGYATFSRLNCGLTHTATATLGNRSGSVQQITTAGTPGVNYICNGRTQRIQVNLPPSGTATATPGGPTLTPTNTPSPTATPTVTPVLDPISPSLTCENNNGVLELKAYWTGNSNTTGCTVWIQAGNNVHPISTECNSNGIQSFNKLPPNNTDLVPGTGSYKLFAKDGPDNTQYESQLAICPGSDCSISGTPTCNGSSSSVAWTINPTSSACQNLKLYKKEGVSEILVSTSTCASSLTTGSLTAGEYTLEAVDASNNTLCSSQTVALCVAQPPTRTPTPSPTGPTRTPTPSPTGPTRTPTPNPTSEPPPGANTISVVPDPNEKQANGQWRPSTITTTVSGPKGEVYIKDGSHTECISEPCSGWTLIDDNRPTGTISFTYTLPPYKEPGFYTFGLFTPSAGAILDLDVVQFIDSAPTETVAPSPTPPGDICDGNGVVCRFGVASGCSITGFSPAQHQDCRNRLGPPDEGNQDAYCQRCVPPTPTCPPGGCFCRREPAPNTVPECRLLPDSHTLEITYHYSSFVNPAVVFYRNSFPGFVPSGSGSPVGNLVGSQFGNYGQSEVSYFDTRIQPWTQLYYQVETNNGATSAYSPTWGILTNEEPNRRRRNCHDDHNIILESVSQTASTAETFTFDVVYKAYNYWSNWGAPRGCSRTSCVPVGAPPYLKIDGSATGIKYVPWVAGTIIDEPGTPMCLGTHRVYGTTLCSLSKYRATYTVAFPPGKTETFTVTGYEANRCDDLASIDTQSFTGGTSSGAAPTPVAPGSLSANTDTDSDRRKWFAQLSWSPSGNGQEAKAYEHNIRWPFTNDLGQAASTTRPGEDGLVTTYIDTDDMEQLPGGYHYYGASIYSRRFCPTTRLQSGQKRCYWQGYSVSGKVFIDKNKNDLKEDGPEVNYTDLPRIKITATSGSYIHETTTDANGEYRLPELAGGNNTYNIKISNLDETPYDGVYPQGDGYRVTVGKGPNGCIIYPRNFRPNETTTTPPAPNPAVCDVDATNEVTGNMSDLNFAIRKQPWFQGKGGDMRIDTGFSDKLPHAVPTTGPTPTPYYASEDGYAQVSTNKTPGLIFGGTDGVDTGRGEPSTKGWNVSGEGSKFRPASPAGIRTSYAYILGQVDRSKITKIDFTCNPCSLSSLASGAYTTTADVTLNASTLQAEKNIILLVNGKLTINGDIIVPNGSTLMVAVKGDIIVSKNLGQVVTNPAIPALECKPSIIQGETSENCNIEGFYSADGIITLEGNNGDCLTPPVGAPPSPDQTYRDKHLTIAGALITNAKLENDVIGLQNQRDLCDVNIKTPSFKIVERPDLIINLPDLLKIPNYIWQEIAP